ncbi:1-phosphofructokinase family hexose kinase [Paractinoplanes brasiliensis]|uniref:1-phosphofructokinase/tagatose 6-phosphate kinase n=1 Tax=Paractinoplanes brasiliensis TaxID=52695 RepID=A0A4R6JYD3_9ACTN|nr:hexose kinase [Actinoplanes brasiliensis]TDO41854.1 1-phosphofructokinase/tagatose 6-phosphate kinase [Actinoplanes brasiliensis]GID29868.1 tagatose-6-phosphate kinase [Actinoplanes brasiliensis]
MSRVVTVTLNPAIDITYDVASLIPGGSVRVGAVRSRAGGKGINVAAVVRALGGDTVAVAPAALRTPDPFRDGLDRLGLSYRLVPAFDAVRRTIAVVGADGSTTVLLEPGSPAPPGTPEALAAAVAEELASADALVVSGSVPPGLPADLPARLVALAAARGVPAIADVSGEALRLAAGAGAVLMPNRDELAELVGAAVPSARDVAGWGRRLLDGGAAAVVVTLGEQGAVAVTPPGAWLALPAETVDGNPTGAGDAAAAALALQLTARASWPDALTDAVATAAACVLRPVAGDIDLEARARWRDDITVEELP